MRKLDSLILKSFIGPFVLTTFVATFVLLIQYMMKYFDDFVGKNLGAEVFAELIGYFSLNMLQVALPLGVLVSSLMTFGNLGEHFELTAIKGAGISLLRALRPIFFFVVVLTFAAFEFNNYIVPAANLQAYSLLYDIKHKKPALDIKEGVFYNGIPDYSIKVKEKLPDNKTLKEVLIYDHTSRMGNNRVILADSSRMYMIFNERYLKLELFDGNYYSEEPKARSSVDQFYRTKFDRMDMVFNLSSFDLQRTKKELFQNNRQMKNISELTYDIDSMQFSISEAKNGFLTNVKGFFSYHLKGMGLELDLIQKRREQNVQEHRKDSVRVPIENEPTVENEEINASMLSPFLTEQKPAKKSLVKTKKSYKDTAALRERNKTLKKVNQGRVNQVSDKKELLKRKESIDVLKSGVDSMSGNDRVTSEKRTPRRDDGASPVKQLLLDTLSWEYLDEVVNSRKQDVLVTAKNQAQNIKVNLTSVVSRVNNLERDVSKFAIEKYKKYSQAFACIVMFLIGAPLGAIIKKGGLGVPVIVSILFFLLYYVLNIMNEKWAKEGMMDPMLAVWVADLCLLPIGLFCLRQARVDARLFETDFYNIWIDKLKERFLKR